MASESFRRQPALEVKVSEIRGQDQPLALLGQVKAVKPEEMQAVLSDESGEVKLSFEEAIRLDKLKEGELVRVIGKPFLKDDETRINVEAIHGMAGLDLELYRRVKELEEEFGVRE